MTVNLLLQDHIRLIIATSQSLTTQSVRTLQHCATFIRDTDLSSIPEVEILRLADIFGRLSVVGYSSDQLGAFRLTSESEESSVLYSDTGSDASVTPSSLSRSSSRAQRMRAEALRCMMHIFRKRADAVYDEWGAIALDVPDRPGLFTLADTDPSPHVRRFALHAVVALLHAKQLRSVDLRFPIAGSSYIGKEATAATVCRGCVAAVIKLLSPLSLGVPSADRSSALGILPELASLLPWRRFNDRQMIAEELFAVLVPLLPETTVLSAFGSILPNCGSAIKIPAAIAIVEKCPASPATFEAVLGMLLIPTVAESFPCSSGVVKLLRKGLIPGTACVAAVKAAGEIKGVIQEADEIDSVLEDLFTLTKTVDDGPLLAEIVEATGKLVTKQDSDQFILLVSDFLKKSARVRASVAKAVATAVDESSDSRCLEILIKLLTDTCIDVQITAVRELSGYLEIVVRPKFDSEITETLLLLAKNDEVPGVRRERLRADALRSLGLVFTDSTSPSVKVKIVQLVIAGLSSKNQWGAAISVVEKNLHFLASSFEIEAGIRKLAADGKSKAAAVLSKWEAMTSLST